MTPHSVLLINDMILPETGCPPFSTALDLIMLSSCGSLERTEKQWNKLLEDVGLKIKTVMVYDDELFHGILAVTIT